MKTTSTPALQFSGYPLKIVQSSNEESEPLQVIPAENLSKFSVAVKTTSQNDSSAMHWDESWFANYE